MQNSRTARHAALPPSADFYGTDPFAKPLIKPSISHLVATVAELTLLRIVTVAVHALCFLIIAK